jgi:hypothetical protein
MRTILALLLLAAPAFADVSIDDNQQTVTVDCAKDPNVNVSGNEATVTLTGTCEKVQLAGNRAKVTGSTKAIYVPGNDNVATLDAVDQIGTPGNKNKVTYKKTVDAKLKKAKVSNPGNKNAIAKVK